MGLPGSGIMTAAMINQELGRAWNSPLSLNDPEVRDLADRPSGIIAFSHFHGKSSEIVVTISAHAIGAYRNLADYFGADWSTATNKRLVINSGIRVSALYVTAAFGGILTIENHGIIEGMGGAANSGAGGYGLYTNQGSPSTFKVINNGTIRGGGGGGGKGGTGGTGGGGYYNYDTREPASGWYYNLTSGGHYWNVNVSSGFAVFAWGSTISPQFSYAATSYTYGGYTYYRGNVREVNSQTDHYEIARIYHGNVANTSGGAGGAGGAGGRGVGSDQSRLNGSGGAAGALGGTNAGRGGTGGTGGAGGDWGQAGGTGYTGATGQAGNRTAGYAGAAGAGGGRGGFSIQGYNRVDYSGGGALVGSTANT